MVQKKVTNNLKLDIEEGVWTYRGEGKTGLVVTNHQLPDRVLKLRKDLGCEDDYLSLYLRNSLYVSTCIAPIFGPLLCYGQIVKLPEHFTSTIVSKVSQYRRISLKYSQLDEQCPYALLMPDACALGDLEDVLTIEIKPKAYIRTASDTNNHHINCCRFCSQIDQRYQERKISQKTKYCPRKLFSNKTSLVSHAINDLLDSPLSYLTVHKNGKRIFSEDNMDINTLLSSSNSSSRSELLEIIVKILLSPHYNGLNVLQIVEKAQHINKKSITELYAIYKCFADEGLDLDVELSKWLDHTSLLSEKYLELLEIIIHFSISVIAQDLSIMLSISEVGKNGQNGRIENGLNLQTVYVNGRCLRFKVSIVDVDLKSVNKLPVYLKQEQELLNP